MKFLLDQNVEARVAVFLKDQGHDATRIGRDYPAGLPDEEVLAIAHREQRILLTNDKDFGDLIVLRQLPHVGVVLFRLPLDVTAEQRIRALESLLLSYRHQLDRSLVVTPQGVRVR